MKLAILVTIVLNLISARSLEIKPSFSAESCAWHATDVVVVHEGDVIDGKVKVTEVWTGALEVGASLDLTQLAVFAKQSERTVSSPFAANKGTIVGGHQLILFLKREGAKFIGANRWTSKNESMRTSTAWVHDGKLFAFHQAINPGDVSMSLVHKYTLDSLKSMAQRVATNREKLNRALEMSNQKSRAEQIVTIHPNLPYEGREACLEAITKCGPAGYDSAWKLMIAMDKNVRRNVYKVLVACDSDRAIPFLIEVIVKETEYFTRHKNRLNHGWWNGEQGGWKQAQIDRGHYSDAHRALYVLAKSKDQRLVEPVRTLRELWLGHQPYNDPSGLNQMAKACQTVLTTQNSK